MKTFICDKCGRNHKYPAYTSTGETILPGDPVDRDPAEPKFGKHCWG